MGKTWRKGDKGSKAGRRKLSRFDDPINQSLNDWYAQYAQASYEDPGFSEAIAKVRMDDLDNSAIHRMPRIPLRPNIEDGLCKHCSRMLGLWPERLITPYSGEPVGGQSTEAMEAGSRFGCRCCSFLVSILQEADLLDLFRAIERRLSGIIRDFSCTICACRDERTGSSQIVWINFPDKVDLRVMPQTSCACRLVTIPRIIPQAADEVKDIVTELYHPTEASAIIKKWLQVCDHAHPSCADAVMHAPTRLLHLIDDCILLVSTENMHKSPRYTTLSYCWGVDSSVRLTTDNLYDLSTQGMAVDELPNIYKQAITLTRALGLEYTWIDALCIILEDDDGMDWHKESSTMRSIYGGSYINIAAASATSVHGDMLPTSNQPIGFSIRVGPISHMGGMLRTFAKHGAYERSTAQSHLATRLFWECREHVASSVQQEGVPEAQGAQLVRAADNAWIWDDIVRHYSSGHLSRPSDKLSALSGIARRQHEIINDTYLAGMWRVRFIEQLVWTSASPTNRRTPAWRAPSWSWMSIDGPIRYDGCWTHQGFTDQREFVKVHHVATRPMYDDFGAIKAAKLELCCATLVQTVVQSVTSTASIIVSNGSYHEHQVQLDSPADDQVSAEQVLYMLPVFSGRCHSQHQHEICQGKDSSFVGGDGRRRATAIRGLVLRQIHSGFQRIGCFSYVYDRRRGAGSEAYFALEEAMSSTGHDTAAKHCSRVLQTDDSRRFVLDIA